MSGRDLTEDEQRILLERIERLSSFANMRRGYPVPDIYTNWRAISDDIALIKSALIVMGVLPDVYDRSANLEPAEDVS